MWIAVPVASFLAAIVLHGIAMRLPLRVDSVRRFLLVGMPLGIAIVVWAVMRGPDAPGVAAVAFYAVLCEIYMFCFTLVIGSVSVATLMALCDGAVDEAELMRRSDGAAMVQVRLGRLRDVGLIAQNDGVYVLTPKGWRLHHAFSGLRRFFGHASP